MLRVSKDQPKSFSSIVALKFYIISFMHLTKKKKYLVSFCPVSILTGVSISLFPLSSQSCNSEHGDSF